MALWRGGAFRAFGEIELESHLDELRRQITADVHGQADNYLLNVNETDFIEHLTSKYAIAVPELNFDELSISQEERMIPAEQFPSSFYVVAGKRYAKPVYIVHIPVAGDMNYLRMIPSTRLLWTTEVKMGHHSLDFEVLGIQSDPDVIRREIDSTVHRLQQQFQNLKQELDRFNASLQGMVGGAVSARRQELLRRGQQLSAIGIPLRQRENLPQTYAVPKPEMRKPLSVKPAASSASFQPEPTLDLGTYTDVLTIIHDLGKVFERMPSLVSGKGEEDLRDQILLYLTPKFEGTATGETFNKRGKTDILLRHENSTLFVGECKFWHGPKGYLATLDQLLTYLTWRDSKAAVILFASTREISTVLRGVEATTPSHPNYLRDDGSPREGWYQYRFHLNGDRNREVHLAVLVIHTPPSEQG